MADSYFWANMARRTRENLVENARTIQTINESKSRIDMQKETHELDIKKKKMDLDLAQKQGRLDEEKYSYESEKIKKQKNLLDSEYEVLKAQQDEQLRQAKGGLQYSIQQAKTAHDLMKASGMLSEEDVSATYSPEKGLNVKMGSDTDEKNVKVVGNQLVRYDPDTGQATVLHTSSKGKELIKSDFGAFEYDPQTGQTRQLVDRTGKQVGLQELNFGSVESLSKEDRKLISEYDDAQQDLIMQYKNKYSNKELKDIIDAMKRAEEL